MPDTPPCPACGSAAVVRNGTHQATQTQKLFCQSCQRHFRGSYRHKGWTQRAAHRMQALSWQGVSIRDIARTLGVSPHTVWEKQKSWNAECLAIARQRRKQGTDPLETMTPLRYPGGKSKALPYLLPHIPRDIQEYREPFLGGGSVFFAVKALFGDRLRYWLNDLNREVLCFWQVLRDHPEALIAGITDFRQRYATGQKLFQILASFEPQDDLERAARFFILNRITFSGAAESGGFSASAYEQRFTDSAIAKLREVSPWLAETRLTQAGYESSLETPGDRVLLFLDPPYLTAEKSKLYGQRGNLHAGFDHARLAFYARSSPHRWIITYDDAPEIRTLFGFARITQWRQQYGMNNVRQDNAPKGKELIIRNF